MSYSRPELTVVGPDRVREFVDGALTGDREASESLARWCLPRVRRTVLLSCGAGPDVDDLVQSTMAIVLTKLDTYRGEASFMAWVDRITVNVVRGHYRRQRWTLTRTHDYRMELQTRSSGDPGRPDRAMDGRQLFDRLSYHLLALKPSQRLPLILSLVQGYSVPEVAAILELSFEATKKRLLRGRRALEKRLRHDPRCQDLMGGMMR